jgi:hypothetical protein
LPDLVIAPQQLLAEGVPVKAQAMVEIRHRGRDRVDLLNEGDDSYSADLA